MKKTYQNPNTRIVKIHTQHLMTASQVGIGESVSTASGAQSRRGGSFWDDEEE